ncbi:MAG: discoidin domain-containing protein [Lachnospiraceae bacterium]
MKMQKRMVSILCAVFMLFGTCMPNTGISVQADTAAKIDMTTMITNGTVKLYDSWNSTADKRTEEQTKTEALKLFDGDTSNTSDFRPSDGSGAGGFVIFDFGSGYEVSLSQVNIQARPDQVGRITGARLQGANVLPDPWYSNDGWTDLTSQAVNAADMQSLTVNVTDGYRYIRLYNSNTWFGNASELELYGTYGETQGTFYDISLDSDMQGGSVKVVSSAKENTDVTVSSVPEADYLVKDYYYYTSSNPTQKIVIENGTFVMPSENIVLGATFERLTDDDSDGFIRLNREAFTASANSQHSSSLAAYAIDGDNATIWHSDWTKNTDKFSKDGAVDGELPPYMLTVDIGKELPVSGFSYVPRTGNSYNGVITSYELQVSSDNTNWNTIAVGDWSYDVNHITSEERYSIFNPVTARYIRLIARDALSNSSTYMASAAEIGIDMAVDSASRPVDDKKAELQGVVNQIPADTTDVVLSFIRSEGLAALEDTYVDAVALGDLIDLYDYYFQSLTWIEQDINPVYFERLNQMLADQSLSAASINTYVKEMNLFLATGKELSEDVIRDMGPEYVMSDEEKDMTLVERMAGAVQRAKAQIDRYPNENYIMLKELISYITRGDNPNYTDTKHVYGTDASTCEYIVTNINYTLQNLDGRPYLTDEMQYESGTTWLDKYGSKISAGGGQIIEGGDGKYYWYGEDNKVAYSLRTGVSCYSTTDFRQWTYEGLAFNVFTDEIESNKEFASEFLTDTILGTQGRIERPKVLYNEKNDNYVMWMHLEKGGRYDFSCGGVAVSENGPAGPFEWKWYGKPVYDPNTTYNARIDQALRDMTLFKDEDGTAYVIYSAEGNRVPYLVRLNDDYTWIDTEGMNTVSKEDFENGTVSYNDEGVYYTGTMYEYNSDGTGYVDAEGNDYTLTEEDLKTLVYMDTTTAGLYNNFTNIGTHNYYLPSFTRYQLRTGNRILIRTGTTVDRADGLEYIPTTPEEYKEVYGRWAKLGQYESGLSNNRESPCVIYHNGYYYMVASGITGWKANTGIYLRTKNLFDEWETVDNPFTGDGQTNYTNSYSYNKGYWESGYYPDRGKSFLSQSTCLFEYNGTVYYMGDRWKDGDYWDGGHLGVKKSTYVWAPVTFTESEISGKDNMAIYWNDSFKIAGVLLGDVNGDGRVTAVDALLCVLHPSDISPEIGDMDGNGTVDSEDAKLILERATR